MLWWDDDVTTVVLVLGGEDDGMLPMMLSMVNPCFFGLGSGVGREDGDSDETGEGERRGEVGGEEVFEGIVDLISCLSSRDSIFSSCLI